MEAKAKGGKLGGRDKKEERGSFSLTSLLLFSLLLMLATDVETDRGWNPSTM